MPGWWPQPWEAAPGTQGMWLPVAQQIAYLAGQVFAREDKHACDCCSKQQEECHECANQADAHVHGGG